MSATGTGSTDDNATFKYDALDRRDRKTVSGNDYDYVGTSELLSREADTGSKTKRYDYVFAGGNPVSNIEWDGHKPQDCVYCDATGAPMDNPHTSGDEAAGEIAPGSLSFAGPTEQYGDYSAAQTETWTETPGAEAAQEIERAMPAPLQRAISQGSDLSMKAAGRVYDAAREVSGDYCEASDVRSPNTSLCSGEQRQSNTYWMAVSILTGKEPPEMVLDRSNPDMADVGFFNPVDLAVGGGAGFLGKRVLSALGQRTLGEAALSESGIGLTTEDILSSATLGQFSKSAQHLKSGGVRQANADFDALTSGVNVVARPRGLRTATLSNGTKVNVRPFSSGDVPTLELATPGNPVIKIRYGGSQ